MPRLRYLAAVIIFSSLIGCLRYVPSRTELDAESDQPSTIGGEEDFVEFEGRLQADLEKLVLSREQLFRNLDASSYHIGPGDLLKIEVFGLPELEAEVRVRPNGTISLSLLDEVKVADLTESELQQELTKKLRPYVRSPKVKVFITTYDAHKVSVIGEVENPGTYALKRDKHLLIDLLSEAGGRTDRASGRVIVIPP